MLAPLAGPDGPINAPPQPGPSQSATLMSWLSSQSAAELVKKALDAHIAQEITSLQRAQASASSSSAGCPGRQGDVEHDPLGDARVLAWNESVQSHLASTCDYESDENHLVDFRPTRSPQVNLTRLGNFNSPNRGLTQRA